jgi:LuxR family quorum-sensing system transcriptional regulator CciR
MSRFGDVQAFVREANRATQVSDLKVLLEGTVRELGFDYFALIHHVDLNAPPGGAVRLDNYPPSWLEVLLARRYFVDDPVLTATQRSAAGFLWSDVPQMIPLTSRQKEILSSAEHEGIGGGFTVPVHVPGEFAGSCSFGVRFGRPLAEAALPALQYVGCFAFEAARRVARLEAARATGGSPARPPRLTPRQLDCVVLASHGKSDWDMGKILSISPETVHQHLEDAKRRYGVATRTQLVVRALFDSQLTFKDAMGLRQHIP